LGGSGRLTCDDNIEFMVPLSGKGFGGRRFVDKGPVTAFSILAILPWRPGEDARLPRANEAIPAGTPPTVGIPGGVGAFPTLGKEKDTA